MSRPRNKRPNYALTELFKKAAEDVPLRSGIETFGKGAHRYTKMAMDGSTRIFRFRSLHQARQAMAIGIQAEAPSRD